MHKTFIVMVALLAPALAAAQESDGIRGNWNFTFTGGAAVPVGGEFHEGGLGTVLGLPTVVDSKNAPDVYDPSFAWRAGIGYGVARHVELFGDFAWKRAEASELSVGNVAGLDLRAQFGNYTSYGADGGMRFHFAPDAKVNPYVSALAGFRYVEAIPGTFSVPAAGVTLADTPFYDNSTVPVVGADVGVLVEITPRLSMGFEGGFRYQTDLKDLEGLAGTGLENLNDVGRNWSVPVSGVLRVRF
jgi:hypothetical protein